MVEKINGSNCVPELSSMDASPVVVEHLSCIIGLVDSNICIVEVNMKHSFHLLIALHYEWIIHAFQMAPHAIGVHLLV